MSLLLGDIAGTHTWGGRLAELGRTAEPPARAEATARLVEARRRGEVVLLLLYAVPPPIVLSRTFGGRSIAAAGPAADWRELRNRRRVALIDKKYGGGLSPAEEAELDELQAEQDAYLDAVQPPPFDRLHELEALARQLAASPSRPAP